MAKRIDPRLSPDDLRDRAFQWVVKARQCAERAELYYRAADRRERARDDKITEKWPWPCGCGAAFSCESELLEHRQKCSEARSQGFGGRAS